MWWNADDVAARAATAAVAVELLLLLLELPGGPAPPARVDPPWLLSTRRGGRWGDKTGLVAEFPAGGWSLNDNNLFLEHGESP